MELLETSSDEADASVKEEGGGSIVLSSIDELLGKDWDASGVIDDAEKKKLFLGNNFKKIHPFDVRMIAMKTGTKCWPIFVLHSTSFKIKLMICC